METVKKIVFNYREGFYVAVSQTDNAIVIKLEELNEIDRAKCDNLISYAEDKISETLLSEELPNDRGLDTLVYYRKLVNGVAVRSELFADIVGGGTVVISTPTLTGIDKSMFEAVGALVTQQLNS